MYQFIMRFIQMTKKQSFQKECGYILKEYRLKNELSVSDVISYLAKQGVQNIHESAYYNWEQGLSLPNTCTFLHLCRLYQIYDILTTFHIPLPDTCDDIFRCLTRDEYVLLLAYRLHPEMHLAVQQLLNLT